MPLHYRPFEECFDPVLTINFDLAEAILKIDSTKVFRADETEGVRFAFEHLQELARTAFDENREAEVQMPLRFSFAIRNATVAIIAAYSLKISKESIPLCDEEMTEIHRLYQRVQSFLDADRDALNYAPCDFLEKFYLEREYDDLFGLGDRCLLVVAIAEACMSFSDTTSLLKFLVECISHGTQQEAEIAGSLLMNIEHEIGELEPCRETHAVNTLLAMFGPNSFQLKERAGETIFIVLDANRLRFERKLPNVVSSILIIASPDHKYFGDVMVFGADKRLPPIRLSTPPLFKQALRLCEDKLSNRASIVEDGETKINDFYFSFYGSVEMDVLRDCEPKYSPELMDFSKKYSAQNPSTIN